MGRARGDRDRAEWVARWRASGLSGREFAEKHGLRASTLYQWAHRVDTADATAGRKHGAAKRPDLAFAEIKIRRERKSEHGEHAAPRGVIEIVSRSGRVVRVQGDVDAGQLRAVLEVVEQC